MESFCVRFRLLSVVNASCHAYIRLSDNMWRYLEGVKPPQKRKTPEGKATYFRDYDKNKRTCSYQSEWEQGRSWLKDTNNDGYD